MKSTTEAIRKGIGNPPLTTKLVTERAAALARVQGVLDKLEGEIADLPKRISILERELAEVMAADLLAGHRLSTGSADLRRRLAETRQRLVELPATRPIIRKAVVDADLALRESQRDGDKFVLLTQYLALRDAVVAAGRAGQVPPAPELDKMAAAGRLVSRFDEVARLLDAIGYLDGLQRNHDMKDAKLETEDTDSWWRKLVFRTDEENGGRKAAVEGAGV